MKKMSILLSYVFDNYLKTCKLLEVQSPNDNTSGTQRLNKQIPKIVLLLYIVIFVIILT
jgi:hypothetical protein